MIPAWVRKISSLMTSCYYQSWVHLHSAVAQCMLLKALDLFSLCLVLEHKKIVSVTSTSSSPLFPCIISSPSHRAKHAYRPTRNTSFSVVFNRAFGVSVIINSDPVGMCSWHRRRFLWSRNSSSSLVFSPKAGFGRNQSPVRRPVWLWHTTF